MTPPPRPTLLSISEFHPLLEGRLVTVTQVATDRVRFLVVDEDGVPVQDEPAVELTLTPDDLGIAARASVEFWRKNPGLACEPDAQPVCWFRKVGQGDS